MIDKLKKALLTGAAFLALGAGTKAVADEFSDVLTDKDRKAVISNPSNSGSKGYFSLDAILWPGGHGEKIRARIDGNAAEVPFGIYLSGTQAKRGDVGYSKGIGSAEIILGDDRFNVRPCIVGETTSYFGDSLIEEKNLGGLGTRIDLNVEGLSIDGILFKEWGNHQFEGAEGKNNAERLLYGLRGTLGKKQWRAMFYFKNDEKEFQHLGNIRETEFGGGIQYRGNGVLVELSGGREKIKYNPGNEFQTNYVEACVSVRLGKNCHVKVNGRYNFDGASRLSRSPIPRREFGVSVIIPFGYGTKPKRRNHNPHLPRSKLGRR